MRLKCCFTCHASLQVILKALRRASVMRKKRCIQTKKRKSGEEKEAVIGEKPWWCQVTLNPVGILSIFHNYTKFSFYYIYSQLITALHDHPAFCYIGRLRPLWDDHPCHLVYVARKSSKQSTQETDELNHTL